MSRTRQSLTESASRLRPLPADCVVQLLAQTGLISASAISKCLERWQYSSSDHLLASVLIKRLKAYLQDLGLSGVHVQLIPLARANLSCLPAILYDGLDWQMVSSSNIDLLLARLEDIKQSQGVESEFFLLWIGRANGGSSLSASLSTVRDSQSFGLVRRELFRDRRWLSRIFVYTLALNIFAVLTSIFAMQVYDRVVPTLAFSTLTTLVVGILLILVLELIFRVRRARMLDRLACSVDQRISEYAFNHLLSIRLDRLPSSLGSLAAQLNSLESIRQFIATAIVYGVVDIPFTIFFLAVIWTIGGIVVLPYLLMVPFALVIGVVSHNRLGSHISHHISKRNEREGLLVDSIRGFETIKTANLQSHFSSEWQGLVSNINSGYGMQRDISNTSSFATSSLSTLAYVFAIVLGVAQISKGNFSTGGMVACSILGSRVLGPIAQSAQFLTQWQTVRQSLKIVDSILALDPDRDTDSLLAPRIVKPQLDLQDLEFSYPGQPVKTLDIPRLSIKPGERIIVAGSTGCGKSTLFKILAGLFHPSRGHVRLAQVDIRELEPDILYDVLGYLPQTVHLFKGTLLSNLTLGSLAVDDDHLIQVRADLGIDTIALQSPKGIELPISEGGAGLSRGQEQLAALARLMIARPRIWLLDEPTSSLDPDNERKVWASISKYLRKDDILIVSTHKPSALFSIASRMIVMSSGRIVLDDRPSLVLEQLTRTKRIA